MNRLWLLLIFFALTRCGNEDGHTVLNQPPYNSLTDSINRFPSNAGLHYRRGVLLFNADQLNYAKEDLRKAFELEPSEVYALSVVTVLKKSSTDSALLFINEALQKLPNSIALQIGKARGYESKKNPVRAIQVCDAILQQYPGQLDALQLKASLLKDQNKSAESLQVLESAYRYAPDDVDLIHTLAFDYAEAKDPKALRLADSLIRADERDIHPEPYYFKGVYYLNSINYSAAIQQFDQAIVRDKNFLEAYINKGIAYYEQKKYPNALKTFNLAIALKSNFADAYYWTGKTLEAAGNKAEARFKYQQAYGFDKTMIEAKEAAEKIK